MARATLRPAKAAKQIKSPIATKIVLADFCLGIGTCLAVFEMAPVDE